MSIASWCEDEKLAQNVGVEHRLLKAGVHRLRVSDGESEALDSFRRPADGDPNGTILGVATIRPSDLRVRTLRTQAAINTVAFTRMNAVG